MAALYLHNALFTSDPSDDEDALHGHGPHPPAPGEHRHSRTISNASSRTHYSVTTVHSSQAPLSPPTEALLSLGSSADPPSQVFFDLLNRQPMHPDGPSDGWDLGLTLEGTPETKREVRARQTRTLRRRLKRLRWAKTITEVVIGAWATYCTVRYYIGFTVYSSHDRQITSLVLGTVSLLSLLSLLTMTFLSIYFPRAVIQTHSFRFLGPLKTGIPYFILLFLFVPALVNFILLFVWRHSSERGLAIEGRCNWDIDVVWSGTGYSCDAGHSMPWGAWLAGALLRLILTTVVLIAYHILSRTYHLTRWPSRRVKNRSVVHPPPHPGAQSHSTLASSQRGLVPPSIPSTSTLSYGNHGHQQRDRHESTPTMSTSTSYSPSVPPPARTTSFSVRPSHSRTRSYSSSDASPSLRRPQWGQSKSPQRQQQQPEMKESPVKRPWLFGRRESSGGEFSSSSGNGGSRSPRTGSSPPRSGPGSAQSTPGPSRLISSGGGRLVGGAGEYQDDEDEGDDDDEVDEEDSSSSEDGIEHPNRGTPPSPSSSHSGHPTHQHQHHPQIQQITPRESDDLHGFVQRFRNLVAQMNRETEEALQYSTSQSRAHDPHQSLSAPPTPHFEASDPLLFEELGILAPDNRIPIMGGYVRRMSTIESIGSREAVDYLPVRRESSSGSDGKDKGKARRESADSGASVAAATGIGGAGGSGSASPSRTQSLRQVLAERSISRSNTALSDASASPSLGSAPSSRAGSFRVLRGNTGSGVGAGLWGSTTFLGSSRELVREPSEVREEEDEEEEEEIASPSTLASLDASELGWVGSEAGASSSSVIIGVSGKTPAQRPDVHLHPELSLSLPQRPSPGTSASGATSTSTPTPTPTSLRAPDAPATPSSPLKREVGYDDDAGDYDK